jgi:hypothetical protein
MTSDEIRQDAHDERLRLTRQEQRQHQARLDEVVRQHDEALAHIETVYLLRLSALHQPGIAGKGTS